MTEKEQVLEMMKRVRPLTSEPIVLKPADPADLILIEKKHDVRLPGEMKEWFSLCDGADINPGGLCRLFDDRPGFTSIDWWMANQPEWRQSGWLPIASDGCGDYYVVLSQMRVGPMGTSPVAFIDQSDYRKLDYVTASGLWKFFWFLFERELLFQDNRETYWPFDKEKVLRIDPALAECDGLIKPWDVA
jgi:cell wall assembly regulator SMI1